jgi:hypothetical protein
MGDGLGYDRRQQVPDLSVRYAADQYEEGAQILWDVPPEAFVLIPFLSCSMIAVELYLKSLCSEMKFVPDTYGVGGFTVHSSPDEKSHNLAVLLDAMPQHVRANFLEAFSTWPANEGQSFLDWCRPYQGLFMDSRYPFEHGAKISGLKLDRLLLLLAFLKDFVAGYPPEEWVEFGGNALKAPR